MWEFFKNVDKILKMWEMWEMWDHWAPCRQTGRDKARPSCVFSGKCGPVPLPMVRALGAFVSPLYSSNSSQYHGQTTQTGSGQSSLESLYAQKSLLKLDAES